MRWDAEDDESDIARIEFCVGTTSTGCQVKSLTSVPSNSTVIVCDDCELQHDVKYYVTLSVTNNAGLSRTATANGIRVDKTPPIPGRVKQGLVVTSCATDCPIRAQLEGFVDPESGIKSCSFAVKSNVGLVTSFVDIGLSNQTAALGLSLEDGQQYYTVVQCVNGAGIKSKLVQSEPMLVDHTPPNKVRNRREYKKVIIAPLFELVMII